MFAGLALKSADCRSAMRKHREERIGYSLSKPPKKGNVMSVNHGISARDWKFDGVAEFESQVNPRYYSVGMRLFHFHSPTAELSAFVLFTGVGPGAGFKFSWNNRTLHMALDSIESLAKPSIGKEVKVSMPRSRASALTLEALTIRSAFSIDDLSGASGKLTSGGAGAGIGIGALFASASTGGRELFNCQRIGLEFGRLGGSASTLTGKWLVAGTWDD